MLSLTLSALSLAALAVALPYLFTRLLPEGAGWLVVNGALSALVLMLAATGYFVFAYAGNSTAALGPVLRVLGEAPGSAWHFVRLAAMSALIWLPVLILALAQQPKRWKEKVW
jgi:hypothetical protein